tara:strand:- start:193 stop:531 length:339 start_codon:yes stop_codon:yes gene_type:complete
MKKNKLIIVCYFLFFGYELIAMDSNRGELERRISNLEKQVAELQNQSKNKTKDHKLRYLKKGISKIRVKKDMGAPDRVGKFSNGDEIWGFENTILKFDNKGQLQEWSKPFND